MSNNKIRCFSSTSDYRHSHSHHLLLERRRLSFELLNGGDDDDHDDPLLGLVGKGKVIQGNKKEELPPRKKEIEKGTKDKTDVNIADNNSAAETNNICRIGNTEGNNNISLASGASGAKGSSSPSLSPSSSSFWEETGTAASVEKQHTQFSPSFFGSSQVDGTDKSGRRNSIPTRIYSPPGSQIWAKPLNDNQAREIHSWTEGRLEEYEGKVGHVDSRIGSNNNATFQTPDKEREKKAVGKALLNHSSKNIGESSPSSLDPNPILSNSAQKEKELDPRKERREISCLTDDDASITAASAGCGGRTSRDQRWEKGSSRNTTFTGDRPSSSSSSYSSKSTFSDCTDDNSSSSCSSPTGVGFGSEELGSSSGGSILIVATTEEKETTRNRSAPVVVFTAHSSPFTEKNTFTQTSSALPVSVSRGSGVVSKDKLYQRNKSNGSRSSNNNSNANSSRGNSNNSESSPPSGRKHHSILECLVCTTGFHLVDISKKLFAPILHCCLYGGGGGLAASDKHKHPPHPKRHKFKENPRRIHPSLSFSHYSSSSSSSSSHNHNKPKSRRKRGKGRLVRRRRHHHPHNPEGETGPLNKAQLKLWATMDHEDLIRELPTIEKLSNQERLRLAHKRRMLQLKKFQQYEKDLNSNSKKHRGDSDLIRRNLPGKHNQLHHGPGVRKGSRRIRFRNSIMLLEAAGRNDVEEVRLLLESGVNPDVANEDGLTALHQCCIDDNEEMMKILLDYGANVNAEDSEKWTPLHAAATCGHLHLVQYLIARGANLLAVNAEGNMPYDICDDETTLDYIESEMAKRGVTQELIEEIRALPETRMLQEIQRVHTQGGDLEVRDLEGATPLHIASANGYYRVAEFLLDNHAATDVQDKDFWQPIHAAACWGHLDVLELLVQNGADLDARTKNNETPYAICEDPEIKERIIQLRTEQQTKRQNEGRKRPSRTHSTNSRTQSIRRTSQRDKGLTSKRDAADEAQMLRAREELHKENSPSPTTDATAGKNNGPAAAATTTTTTTPVNGVTHPLNGDTQNNIAQNGNGSSEEDPEEQSYPPAALLGRDSVSNMKMKQDEVNRLREIAVKSGAINHQNNHLNNQNNIHNNSNPSNGVKMNNLLYNEQSNGSLRKNQNNIHKNLNTTNNSNGTVSVLSSPDDNGNLLPKPEINPSVDNKVSLGGGLGSGLPLSGSRDNLVGLSNSAGNSTIDIHVSVTINTNSPVSTLTNGGGGLSGGTGSHGLNGSIMPMSPGGGSSIFTPPGTLSDLKKQRSLIRTSSNPLTNGGMNDSMTKYHPPASPTMSLRRYVGDPAETVGDYGDGGKRCCVIV